MSDIYNIQKIKIMTTRKRGRKGNKTKSKIDDAEKLSKFNPHAFFDAEEICQIRAALKIKEALNIPITIGSVILNNFELLKKVVKSGLDINEVGPNNTNALIWAIRYKNFDMVKFLLDNGADPTAKVDNGESIVIVALEHKLWDEGTFIDFWDLVSEISPIDSNSTNKNGHTIIHIAVRREWERFIQKLLAEKVNIDITNINGVSPLMTACFRNNLNIVNVLINHGADFTKEDNHYRTALCYAIITGAKMAKPPFVIAERIIFELKKDLSFKEYIKRRIEIIDLILNKDRISEQESNTLITLTQYIVQYTENGLKIMLEFNIFELIQKVLKNIKNDVKRKLLFQLTQELLSYNERVIRFNPEVQRKLSNQFVNSSIIITCLEIINNREIDFRLAFYVLLVFCTLSEASQKWTRDNREQVKQAFSCLPVDYINFFQKDFPDEKKQKLMRKKMKKLRRYINTIQENTEGVPGTLNDELKPLLEKKSDQFFNIKKSKRRTKVMKAKITKIKHMELSERLSLKNNTDLLTKIKNDAKIPKESQELAPEMNSLTSKIKLSGIKKEETTVEVANPEQDPDLNNSRSISDHQITREIEENEKMVNTFMIDGLDFDYNNSSNKTNPITVSLKQFLQSQQNLPEKEEPSYQPTFPEWKSKICQLPFSDWCWSGEKIKTDKKKLKIAIEYMKRVSNNSKNTGNTITLDVALHVVMEYLKELLELIITKSKTDSELMQEMKPNEDGEKSNYLEKQDIADLQANFHHLISSICSLAYSKLPEALRNIYELESTLLHFPIRGKTLLSEVCALASTKIEYTTFGHDPDSYSILPYIQNVLNGFEDVREDIKISVIDEMPILLENEPRWQYAKEMSMLSPAKPRNKRNELEAKIKTMEGAYHLMDSIEKLLQDDEELDKKHVFPKLDLSKISCKKDPESKFAETTLNSLIKHAESKTMWDTVKSRWAEKIQNLKTMKHNRLLLGSDVRLCRYPERSHVISQGGNFNLVTLGISVNDQPLAVKKIPSEHCVCKILKSLINPLLGLRNKYILHYFICDYEENHLILGTPLCEYNIGQYVLLLKDNSEKNVFNLTQTEIIRQFLNGLAFLHQRMEPIVHGNLKPSNIFVDIYGVVRLAEFGISKALFKLIDAPKSSLIWFSHETYRMYKISSVMECSIYSDIQVAGMLLYFIVSGGVHPFGPDVATILKTLEKTTFTLPPIREIKNQIFTDLVSWMVMHEPSDRPLIKQVLAHVLFWTNDRKWRFVVNCSGISTNGVPLGINTIDLHNAIGETSINEQIKGHWVSIARRKFPTVEIQGEDTVVGFLKFIKQFYETQMLINEENIRALKSCVLTYFPAFPLTLYRILEATGIIKEYPFITYTTPESIVT